MKKAHLSIWQVSELSGTPVSTLRDHRYRGEGLGALGFRLDGRIVFDRAEVEEDCWQPAVEVSAQVSGQIDRPRPRFLEISAAGRPQR